MDLVKKKSGYSNSLLVNCCSNSDKLCPLNKLGLCREVDFLAIQETKKRDVKGMLCSTLFGSGHLGWVHKPTINSVRVILCICNNGNLMLVAGSLCMLFLF